MCSRVCSLQTNGCSAGEGTAKNAPTRGDASLLDQGCTTSERASARLFGGHSIQEFPGLRTIQSPNPRCFDDRGIEVAEVDAHSVYSWPDGSPVCYATARCASTQPKTLVAPRVAIDVFAASNDLDLARFVITPYPSVAATDRTVAARESPGLSGDLDFDCTAVARPREHGADLLCGPTRFG